MKVGIVSYGIYIPTYRLKTEEVARAWQKKGAEVLKSLAISEKSVAGVDEDAVTLATEAALHAFSAAQGKLAKTQIEALLVGSESHPYAVNPTSTTVGEFLGIGNDYLAADLQFACKAGTAAMQAIVGLVEAGKIDSGLAIGSDTAQSKPHDVLEYTSAAAAAAYILGKKNVIAELMEMNSFSSDTPDFWRRDGVRYPSHAGRFTGEPAYFSHVVAASEKLLVKAKMKPANFDYCVFHMPNGRFPRDVAKRLGFSQTQLLPSLTVDSIGNPYSASSLVGLGAVLEIAKPGQTICMVSYGSGAGSDGFVWRVTDQVISHQSSVISQKKTIKDQLARKTYIDYTQYLQMTGKI